MSITASNCNNTVLQSMCHLCVHKNQVTVNVMSPLGANWARVLVFTHCSRAYNQRQVFGYRSGGMLKS